MKDDITTLEKKYWAAMAARDFDTVKNLTKFPCIVAGKQGIMSVDEPSYKKMFDQNSHKIMTVKDISGELVQTGEDHAMIAYLVELDYDGQPMKCACSSTWIKDNGNWKCAMHTESDLEKK